MSGARRTASPAFAGVVTPLQRRVLGVAGRVERCGAACRDRRVTSRRKRRKPRPAATRTADPNRLRRPARSAQLAGYPQPAPGLRSWPSGLARRRRALETVRKVLTRLAPGTAPGTAPGSAVLRRLTCDSRPPADLRHPSADRGMSAALAVPGRRVYSCRPCRPWRALS
jgi:hypothetical protein